VVRVRKQQWWGDKAEKKFDNIFIRFDTISARDIQPDGHATTAIAALTHSVARLIKFGANSENVYVECCELDKVMFVMTLLVARLQIER